jgi:hypothetical protein
MLRPPAVPKPRQRRHEPVRLLDLREVTRAAEDLEAAARDQP